MKFSNLLESIFKGDEKEMLVAQSQIFTLTSFFPGELISVKIHGQTLAKQTSPSQNNGKKQKQIEATILHKIFGKKIEKSSKIGQDKKSLTSIFLCF